MICLNTGNTRKDVPPGAFWGAGAAATRIDLPAVQSTASAQPPQASAKRPGTLASSAEALPDATLSESPVTALPPQLDLGGGGQRSAADERAIRMLAWMASVVQSSADAPPDARQQMQPLAERDWRAISAQLLACAPAIVDLGETHVVSLYEALPQHELAEVLNGSLVALVELDVKGAPGKLDQMALQVHVFALLSALGSNRLMSCAE